MIDQHTKHVDYNQPTMIGNYLLVFLSYIIVCAHAGVKECPDGYWRQGYSPTLSSPSINMGPHGGGTGLFGGTWPNVREYRDFTKPIYIKKALDELQKQNDQNAKNNLPPGSFSIIDNIRLDGVNDGPRNSWVQYVADVTYCVSNEHKPHNEL